MRAIEDGDPAARIADDGELLELAGRGRNAFAADPEHVGDEFLRHIQLV
jgi:hypothetical protein